MLLLPSAAWSATWSRQVSRNSCKRKQSLRKTTRTQADTDYRLLVNLDQASAGMDVYRCELTGKTIAQPTGQTFGTSESAVITSNLSKETQDMALDWSRVLACVLTAAVGAALIAACLLDLGEVAVVHASPMWDPASSQAICLCL